MSWITRSRRKQYIFVALFASLAWICVVSVAVYLFAEYAEKQQLSEVVADNAAAIEGLENEMTKSLQLMQYTVSPHSRWEKTLRAIYIENHNPGASSLPVEKRRAYYEQQEHLRAINTELRLTQEENEVIDQIWLMKKDGTAIAASNAYQEGSFVGERFDCSDYFIDGIRGSKGYQYAIGAVTQVPGIFFATPVYLNNSVIGVVASKVTLSAFRNWIFQRNGMLIDRFGVVIKSHDPRFELMALDSSYKRLSESARLDRYGRTELEQLTMRPLRDDPDSHIMLIGKDPVPYYVANTRLLDERLRMIVITDVSSVFDRTASRILLAVLAGFGTLFIFVATGWHYYFRSHWLIQRRTEITMTHISREKAAAETAGSRFAIVKLALDNFTSVNYDIGFRESNRVLNTIADRINAVVGSGGQLLEREQDTFTVLLRNIDSVYDAERAVIQAQESIARPVQTRGRELALTASAGIALYPVHAQTAADLLSHASMALRSILGSKVSSYAFYSPEMSHNLEAYSQIIEEMKQSLENRDFFLVYQPLLSLKTGQLIGCEALLRWMHPVRGLVPPLDFIPVAESTGFIHELGPWILDEACRQVRAWQNEFGFSIKVSVNISPEQFMRTDLLQQVWDSVAKHSLRPDQLELEMTETLLMSDTERTLGIMREFQRHGLQISIDDFGTGYSSLAYLSKFNANVLKVDRAFVNGMVTNTSDLAVVRAIVSMAKRLDYQVVAEGVETLEQLVLLIEMECDAIQGFGFSRPLPAADFAQFYLEYDGNIRMQDWKSTTYFASGSEASEPGTKPPAPPVSGVAP